MKLLLQEVARSTRASLILGAGISIAMGIPSGYKLPMRFARQYRSLMAELGLETTWKAAQDTGDWAAEAEFVSTLLRVFAVDSVLQRTLLSWLMEYKSFKGTYSNIHKTFVLAWLQGMFPNLITTNWDFLLEWQVEALYDFAYLGDPFEPISIRLGSGAEYNLDTEHLFYYEPLDGNDVAFNPRWDIISHDHDLVDLHASSRPLWKIHGSPFLLACPKCGGWSRWKLHESLNIGDPCPNHPDAVLRPEITFWGQGIDKAHPTVWQAVQDRLADSDLIVVCGLSGSGSDAYLRAAIEAQKNVWIVNPSISAWNPDRVHFVGATASQFSSALQMLLPAILRPPS